ncbi:hypothetical protein DFP72DRAFT_910896 [Ephemerocybe angulata]|uniref:Aminoglycoside phosphotransferase domain-containing protein n=1 Tax=Ephemerocybe angulata TaxID=980116 RepID=A0A8H6M3N4_9AGAR|nr:hypothetical protein DFP72DRAFT_910896 [Tulosesus angulatus]
MPISDCWPALEPSLELLDPPTHKRITSLHQHLLPLCQRIEGYATSQHPQTAPCRMITTSWTWGQSFLVYELVFEGEDADSEQSWVARFGLPPYEGDEFFNTPEQLERKILNEVGALRVVKERTTVPVPDIFGFCARHGDGFQHKFGAPPAETPAPHPHPLGEEFPAFILMSAMKGKTIEDCGIPIHELGGHWDSPTSDPGYRAYLDSDILQRYLTSLADIHVQLSQVTFPQIGSFTMDNGSEGQVRIGPMAEFGLGPFDTAEEYYAVLAEAFKRIAEAAMVEDEEEDDEEDEGPPVVITEAISLPRAGLKTLRRMFAASLFPDALRPHLSPSNNHGPFPLRHGDLHSENILVDEHTGEIIGVIDWEGAGTVPWEVAGALNWEVQGEVLGTKVVPGLGLVRPEIHDAFSKALKEAEKTMKARFEALPSNITRRRPPKRNPSSSYRLSLTETRSSTMSSLSDYATPMSSMSSSSSYVSLTSLPSSDRFEPSSTLDTPRKPKAESRHDCDSPTSSASSSITSFTSFGNSTQEDLESTTSSRSNLNLTSPLTSPATSLFDVNREAASNKEKDSEDADATPAATPNPHRRAATESGAGKLMSWLGFNRAASEGASDCVLPSLSLPQRSPPPPLPLSSFHHSHPPSTPIPRPLSTPIIEAIREPIPSVQTHCITTVENGSVKDNTGKGEEALSLSLAAVAIADFPPSSSRLGSATLNRTPASSPRLHSAHSRYNSMSMHRRQRSSMGLSIPASAWTGRLSPETRSAGVTPGGSPVVSYSPLLPGPASGTHGNASFLHRSRTPSPSPGMHSSHARPQNHGSSHVHSRRPSSFYVPGAMNSRSLSAGSSGAGSYFAGASPMHSPTPPPKTLAQMQQAPPSEFGVLGKGICVTPALLTPVATPANFDMLKTPVKEDVADFALGKALDVVSSPSGHLLSDLHASPASYVAGYLGHWMFVFACEWDTVGRALWHIVKAQRRLDEGAELGHGEGGTEEIVKEEVEEENDPMLEKAFWNWVKNVWAVEQSRREEEEEN